MDSREKNLLSSNMSSRYPHNIVNFGQLASEIVSLVWGTPYQISTGFASWQRYFTARSSGRQSNFAALSRGRHLCSTGRPSRWALAHISSYLSFIIVSICVTFIFHLIIIKFTLYPLLDYTLYRIVRILTAGLQAHINRRSVYLHIV